MNDVKLFEIESKIEVRPGATITHACNSFTPAYADNNLQPVAKSYSETGIDITANSVTSSMVFGGSAENRRIQQAQYHLALPGRKVGTVSEYPHHNPPQTTQPPLRIFVDRHPPFAALRPE